LQLSPGRHSLESNALAIGTEDEDSWDRGDAICAEASGIVFESNLAEVIAIDGLQN
jgi:hypothetical protein